MGGGGDVVQHSINSGVLNCHEKVWEILILKAFVETIKEKADAHLRLHSHIWDFFPTNVLGGGEG